jgi:NitT/TauT family transport system ATP-binding protein
MSKNFLEPTYQNIEFGLVVNGTDGNRRRRVVEELIVQMGLQGAEQRYPKELSGGMKQKTGIARALAVNPTILLMDEPFGSLDQQTRLRLGQDLLEVLSAEPKTVLFVTHNIEEAVTLVDRLIVLDGQPAQIVKEFSLKCRQSRDPIADTFLRDVRREAEELIGVSRKTAAI